MSKIIYKNNIIKVVSSGKIYIAIEEINSENEIYFNQLKELINFKLKENDKWIFIKRNIYKLCIVKNYPTELL